MGDPNSIDPARRGGEGVVPAGTTDGAVVVGTLEPAPGGPASGDRFDPEPVAASAPNPQAALLPVARPSPGDPIQTELRDVWGTTFPDDKDGLERTMRIFDALIRERMRQTGKERKDIVVVVVEHEGRLMEVLPWLRLGVKVVAVEKRRKDSDPDEGLRETLDTIGQDRSHLIFEDARRRFVRKGDIVACNLPQPTGEEDKGSPEEVECHLGENGILILQTDDRARFADHIITGTGWNVLLQNHDVPRGRALIHSKYFGSFLATLLIAQRVPRYAVDELKKARRLAASGVYSPQSLLAILERQPALVHLWSIVVVPNEGFTLEQHTLLVLKQFDRYFSTRFADRQFSPHFDLGLWRVVLALHDIGKPIVVRLGAEAKEEEHHQTSLILREILRLTECSPREIDFAMMLVNGRFGQYVHALRLSVHVSQALIHQNEDWLALLKKALFQKLGFAQGEAEAAWKQLTEERLDALLMETVMRNLRQSIQHWAGITGLSESEVLHFQKIYYMADAGSYSTDATDGVPQLGTKSAFDSLFVFDREHSSMNFAEPYAGRVATLEGAVASADVALSMPVAAHGVPPSSASRTGEATTSTVGSLALNPVVVETAASADDGPNRRGGNDGGPSASLKRRLMAVSTQMALGSVSLLLARMSDHDFERVIRGGRGLARRLLIERGQGDLAAVVGRLRMTEAVFLSVALMARSETDIAKIVGAAPSHSGSSTAASLSLPAQAPAAVLSPSSALQVLR